MQEMKNNEAVAACKWGFVQGEKKAQFLWGFLSRKKAQFLWGFVQGGIFLSFGVLSSFSTETWAKEIG